MSHGNSGKKQSKEHIAKRMIGSCKGWFKKGQISPRKGIIVTEATRELQRQAKLGKSSNSKGKYHTEKSKKLNSDKHLALWQTPEYREKVVTGIIKGNHIRPTLPEKDLGAIINEAFPNQYVYSGDGKIVFPCGCPDYWNINVQKKAILMHGIWWHLWKPQKENPNLTKEDVERIDKEKYKKYGIECLIIWEDELDNREQVIEKLKIFHNNKQDEFTKAINIG